MDIMIPKNDFDFNSARSTPYTSAPSTPKPFGGEYYFSAPPSPDHLAKFYRDFDDFYVDDTKSCSDIPIGWEREINPVSPKLKRNKTKTIFDDDFAFDVSGEIGRMTLPAEELFDGGKIRPLKSVIKVEHRKREEFFPDIKNSKTSTSNIDKRPKEQERGREINISSSPSSSRGRSLSPFRVSKYPWEEEEEIIQINKIKKQSANHHELTSTSSSLSSKSNSKKWSLKDFFLFRSASEGRASDKDPLKKYTALFKKSDEKKISSSRISEGGSVSKRRGPVSAHELHYTKNRAVSEDLKKKTFLPYKQGILGRLFV